MWELKITRQFKKDLKKYRNRADEIFCLSVVLKMLQETGTVSREYKPHLLVGEYTGFMECHVKNDLLLIWLDERENIIKLVRLGTHSELFK
ncbi:addiction module toxin RelE [Muribaculum sp. An289]|uniref:type II toxin-antitoxin system YafQ family toxin n=1 Tax=unclassified Muribaculum TaxID=2622126 RepID=UPI000B36D42A|nr:MULTISPECIES: type II toxin-antitoxin system YafQ family toxin [unclassified Muribaculum]OUO37673.1 addiction module toxin RelE [Muribaculum sp. An289]OUO41587.1 addiction module toxin RelE [Muribaculum sp. An287]